MHPCCGGSLQTGTKIIAILKLLFAIFTVVIGVLVFSGGALVTSASHHDQIQVTDQQREQVAVVGYAVIFVGIFFIVVGVLSILLAALLLSGANKRNQTRCMIWFVLNAIILVLTLLGTVVAIFSKGDKDNATIGFGIISILIDSYFLWVVWAFMAELKEGVEVAFYGGPKPRV